MRRVLLVFLLSRATTLACSCARIEPACEAVWIADAVFVGTVVSISPPTIFGIPLAWPFPSDWRVTFSVKERFRGAPGKTIEVRTAVGCCACGMEFLRSRDYLVYAYQSPDLHALITGICTRTSTLEDAAADLSYLRSLAANPLPAHIYGFVTTDPRDRRLPSNPAEPLAGVPIHLRSDSRTWRTTTDATGAYDFPAIPGGAYSLIPDLPRNLAGGAPRTVSLHDHGCSQQIILAVEHKRN
jgi:hypothetical protein